MTTRVNGNSAAAWRHFDSEAVRNTQGGIHHGESAIQNVRAIGEDAMHAAEHTLLVRAVAAFLADSRRSV